MHSIVIGYEVKDQESGPDEGRTLIVASGFGAHLAIFSL